MTIPDFNNISLAHSRIQHVIHKTPVLSSQLINEYTGTTLFFKCENFQKVGAFKFRGASNAVLSLSNEEAENGVATHSSGNHAAALALAAKNRGISAYIVMPENAPEVKKKAVAGYGTEIFYCKPTLQAREEGLKKVVEKTGASFIHPYDNELIIAGQGTAAKEFLEEIPQLDIIIAPVGGGGLLSGTSIAAKSMKPEIIVIAAEPKGADDAYRSFISGKLIPSINPNTICDGLLTSLSELTFSVIQKNVDEIITVTEDSIIKAMELIWTRLKIIVEPSSSVCLAAVLENKQRFYSKKTGIIISGGNVELSKLPF
ncbi:MAG: pyridoxal-phosphate dependent enzyme [Marinilabiliales bacterium]